MTSFVGDKSWYEKVFEDLPVNGADTGHVILVADALGEQPVPDFPGEHGRVVLLVLRNGVHHVRGRNLGFAAADNSGFVISGFVKSKKNQFENCYIIRNTLIAHLMTLFTLMSFYNITIV